jgi:hypothetical protein
VRTDLPIEDRRGRPVKYPCTEVPAEGKGLACSERRQVQELLKQPVTWAGAHLQADGKKNWVDIASNKVEE